MKIDNDILSDSSFIMKYMEILGGKPLDIHQQLFEAGDGSSQSNYIDYDYVITQHQQMHTHIKSDSQQLTNIQHSLISQASICLQKQTALQSALTQLQSQSKDNQQAFILLQNKLKHTKALPSQQLQESEAFQERQADYYLEFLHISDQSLFNHILLSKLLCQTHFPYLLESFPSSPYWQGISTLQYLESLSMIHPSDIGQSLILSTIITFPSTTSFSIGLLSNASQVSLHINHQPISLSKSNQSLFTTNPQPFLSNLTYHLQIALSQPTTTTTPLTLLISPSTTTTTTTNIYSSPSPDSLCIPMAQKTNCPDACKRVFGVCSHNMQAICSRMCNLFKWSTIHIDCLSQFSHPCSSLQIQKTIDFCGLYNHYQVSQSLSSNSPTWYTSQPLCQERQLYGLTTEPSQEYLSQQLTYINAHQTSHINSYQQQQTHYLQETLYLSGNLLHQLSISPHLLSFDQRVTHRIHSPLCQSSFIKTRQPLLAMLNRKQNNHWPILTTGQYTFTQPTGTFPQQQSLIYAQNSLNQQMDVPHNNNGSLVLQRVYPCKPPLLQSINSYIQPIAIQQYQQAFLYDDLYFHHIPVSLSSFYHLKSTLSSPLPSLTPLEPLELILALETDTPIPNRLSPLLVNLTSSLVSQGWSLLDPNYLDLQHLILLKQHDYLSITQQLTQCLLDPFTKQPLCKQYPFTQQFLSSTKFFIPLSKLFLPNTPINLDSLHSLPSLLLARSYNCRPIHQLCTQGLQWLSINKAILKQTTNYQQSIVKALLSPVSILNNDSTGKLIKVASHYNQCLFVIGDNNRLFFRANSSTDTPFGTHWHSLQTQAISLTLSANRLYYLDTSHSLLMKDMIFGSNSCSTGNPPLTLTLLSSISLVTIYTSPLDCLYGIDSLNTLYALLPIYALSTSPPYQYNLKVISQGVSYIIPEHHQLQVSLMNGHSFIQSHIYSSLTKQCLFGTKQPSLEHKTPLVKAVINQQGCQWALNQAGDLLQKTNDEYIRSLQDNQQQTSFTDISVSSKDLFLLDINGDLKVRTQIC